MTPAYGHIPNPKYARTARPELPLVHINAVDANGTVTLFVGRQYHVAKNGRESALPYVEQDGQRRYISEAQLHGALAALWEQAKGGRV